MAIFNRSTKVHNTVTSEFKRSLKGLKKNQPPAFGTEGRGVQDDPLRQAIAASGIKMRTLRKDSA